MLKTIFNKNIDPSCEYCENGNFVESENLVYCVKKGNIEPPEICKKFKYAPLKRVPKYISNINISEFSKEDFTLD